MGLTNVSESRWQTEPAGPALSLTTPSRTESAPQADRGDPAARWQMLDGHAPRCPSPACKQCPVALVERARAGSRRAFSTLWRKYAPTVQGILLTMVADHEAEDLTQEVAVAAFRALSSLAQPERFPAWLCTIARNAGRDALARQRRPRPLPLEHAGEVAAPPCGDPNVADEILEQVRGLPECYREPLMLRLLLELSGPEISNLTGMTEGSVRVNLCRGMKLLRRRLERMEYGDE